MQNTPLTAPRESLLKKGMKLIGTADAAHFAALIAVIIISAVFTWSNSAALSETYDEPYHIAAGMQWIDQGVYTYELQHPPLARIAVAIFPYINGLRSKGISDADSEGNAILREKDNFRSNLASARLGNLFFLVIACATVFLWARRAFGALAGTAAAFVFATLPPILGHAGLATLDLASAATVALALFTFVQCVDNPRLSNVLYLGSAVGIALLSKFSSIPFLGACFFSSGIALACRSKQKGSWRAEIIKIAARGAIVFATAGILIWAGYRFSLSPLSHHTGNHQRLDRDLQTVSAIRQASHKVIETPIPLGDFISGVLDVATHGKSGHDSYLLGRYKHTGWWYFFPVVIGVKTPISFLILTAIGIIAIVRKDRATTPILTALFPAAILLVCVTSRIDLGVRHILAIYPPMAVISGYAISGMVSYARRTSMAALAIPALLVGSNLLDCWNVRPEELAFFNQLASKHPEKVLAESDLDWGQDLYLLSDRLKVLGVRHVSIKYFGQSPLDEAGLPDYSILTDDPNAAHGYVAISIRYLTLGYAKDGSFSWLRNKPPSEIVGKSIYLYKLP